MKKKPHTIYLTPYVREMAELARNNLGHSFTSYVQRAIIEQAQRDLYAEEGVQRAIIKQTRHETR